LTHGTLGCNLVAHGANAFWARTDERQTRSGNHFSESRILGEKPISWVNCLCAGHLCGKQKSGAVEIALSRSSRTDTDSSIGVLDVRGIPVGL
jgi:hypothetical protein